jgi:hypothetical protein
METLKAVGRAIVETIRMYPKGTLIVWGVSLIAVIVLMVG